MTARKLATSLSFGLAALFLLLVGFVPRDDSSGHTTAVAFLTIAVSALGISTPGWNVNHLDIAPRYGLRGVVHALPSAPPFRLFFSIFVLLFVAICRCVSPSHVSHVSHVWMSMPLST